MSASITHSSADILIVEDDAAIARLIELHLQAAGHQATRCGDGDEALKLLAMKSWSLLILDRMLPGTSGMQILRQLSRRPPEQKIPVLMVTALGSTSDKVQGLNEGADDYLPKPFEPEELVARVGALLRRFSPPESGLSLGGIDVFPDGPEVRVNGTNVELRPLEFRLLVELMKKPGKVRSREYLLDRVWGTDVFVEHRTVDATVKRLRKALLEAGAQDCIETVRGMGYRFQSGQAS